MVRDAQTDVLTSVVPASMKTPLYKSINAARYQRQALLQKIQERSGRKLICYVAGVAAPIDRDDTMAFVDLLHDIPLGTDVDFLLHTVGGDIDAAEKLISMLRNKVGASMLRIIIPDFAKSAGTLMTLGADRLIMSDMSELGPIDPQVPLMDGNGNQFWHSVQSYLDAYESLSMAVRKDPRDTAAQLMLNKLEPATVKQFEAIRDRARRLAEDQLRRGMFRSGNGNFTQTARELLDTKRWQSHGQMISWQDAQDPVIGLIVDYRAPESEEWQEYWQLYCLQRLAVNDRQKLYESECVSLTIDARAI